VVNDLGNYGKLKRVLIIVVGTLLIALMGISTGGRDRISFIENAIGIVVSPVQGFFHNIGNGISSTVSPVFEVWTTVGENEKLKLENIELRTKLIEYSLREKELAELTKLKEVLKFVDENKLEGFVSADVIGKSNDNWYTMFVSSAGAKDGVTRNSTVINESGMIGSVYEVADGYSKIVTLLDEKLAVSFETVDKENTLEGITTGGVDGMIRGRLFDPNATVVVGQTVITSGLGGHPKGIIIGRISRIVENKDDFLINVEIEPSVNFRKIDMVTILPVKPGLFD
jgi:rod shape-determining protein MreC